MIELVLVKASGNRFSGLLAAMDGPTKLSRGGMSLPSIYVYIIDLVYQRRMRRVRLYVMKPVDQRKSLAASILALIRQHQLIAKVRTCSCFCI